VNYSKTNRMTKSEIKGYDLSEDYKQLWDLIHSGHRIPAWIVYSRDYEEPIHDLVEVKLSYMSKRYDIGVRGISYSSFENTFEAFEMNCKKYELRWILLPK